MKRWQNEKQEKIKEGEQESGKIYATRERISGKPLLKELESNNNHRIRAAGRTRRCRKEAREEPLLPTEEERRVCGARHHCESSAR